MWCKKLLCSWCSTCMKLSISFFFQMGLNRGRQKIFEEGLWNFLYWKNLGWGIFGCFLKNPSKLKNFVSKVERRQIIPWQARLISLVMMSILYNDITYHLFATIVWITEKHANCIAAVGFEPLHFKERFWNFIFITKDSKNNKLTLLSLEPRIAVSVSQF